MMSAPTHIPPADHYAREDPDVLTHFTMLDGICDTSTQQPPSDVASLPLIEPTPTFSDSSLWMRSQPEEDAQAVMQLSEEPPCFEEATVDRIAVLRDLEQSLSRIAAETRKAVA